jgi:diacylglycerol kinase (ATP)
VSIEVHKNQHFLRRLRFAGAGLAAAWRSEHSLRYQCVALVCVLIALFVLRLEPMWWAVVSLTCCAVITAELFNTALEHLADHLHPETHPRIRIVKDCAAAAVLVAALGALGVGAALAVHLLHRL